MGKLKEENKIKTKKKREKGITLIALVITIIVLLILAAVSIATLTGQNGILSRADDAKEQTEIASVKEQAQLDIANWIAEKLENGEDSTVNTPEKVQEILEAANQNNENKYYKGFTEIGITTPSGYEVPYEELYTTGSSGEGTTSKTVEDLVTGDRVYYDTGDTSVGEEGIIECIVLYDSSSEYGVQIITADTVGTITLGDSDFNTSRESYNNALKTLYDEAQKYLNPIYASGARCVGSDPAEPDWDTITNEAGYYTKSEGDNEYYEYMDSYYGTLKNGDEQYNTDWTQMGTITNVDIKTATTYYWLASRVANFHYFASTFHVYVVYTSGFLGTSDTLCYVRSDGFTHATSDSGGFRPVFTLNSGIKITEGDGVDTPYTLTP